MSDAPSEDPVAAQAQQPEYEFRECPHCGGYGIRDNGRNCVTCGGSGTHGLRSRDGVIGSGEIIIERASGRIVPYSEFLKVAEMKR